MLRTMMNMSANSTLLEDGSAIDMTELGDHIFQYINLHNLMLIFVHKIRTKYPSKCFIIVIRYAQFFTPAPIYVVSENMLLLFQSECLRSC